MTIYRIQDDLGAPLWVRIKENEQPLTYGNPREVNYWTPGMWEVWEEFLWVFQQLEKYSIPDKVSALSVPGNPSGKPAKQYQYLIQGQHLDYIQLRTKYPLTQLGITVVDTADEE